MKPKLSKSSAGFRNNYIIQHILLKMIGTWDYMLNKANKVGAIVMDFSKACDNLNHKLLCETIAHGFDTNALTLIQSFVSNKYQIKVVEISTGVPQCSIVGPLFLCNLY